MPQKTPSLTSENDSLRENQTHPKEQANEQGNQAQAILSLTEASADELMDSVFEDVDYMLEKGVTSVPTVSAQNSRQIESAEHSLESQEPSQTTDLSTTLVDELVVADESPKDQSSPAEDDGEAQEWQRALKITVPILGACAALGVALAAGFLLHSPLSPFNRGAVAGAEDAPVEPASGEFAGYMKRALDTIASTEQSSPSGRLASNTEQNTGDGPSSLPITPGGVTNRSLSIPERVYIPVYQPPSPSLPALPSVPSQNNVAALPTAGVGTSAGETSPSSPSTNASSPSNSAASDAPTVTVSPTNSSPLPTPSVTPLTPTVQVPVQAAPVAPSSSAPILSELSHDHVLVGLLQLGDRSVAMFDFSEGTHRVKVGEQIGTSGWSLVSVSQNEAVIRRNGDVRSIYIGQSF